MRFSSTSSPITASSLATLTLLTTLLSPHHACASVGTQLNAVKGLLSSPVASFQDLAVALEPGSYTFYSPATKRYLTYDRKSQSVRPDGKEPVPWDVRAADGAEQDDKQRVLGNGNYKCLSAQWGYDIQADHVSIPCSSQMNFFRSAADFFLFLLMQAGVMYACDSSTLEKTKPFWFFIPTDTPTPPPAFDRRRSLLDPIFDIVNPSLDPDTTLNRDSSLNEDAFPLNRDEFLNADSSPFNEDNYPVCPIFLFYSFPSSPTLL
jgi:hypothetical protein